MNNIRNLNATLHRRINVSRTLLLKNPPVVLQQLAKRIPIAGFGGRQQRLAQSIWLVLHGPGVRSMGAVSTEQSILGASLSPRSRQEQSADHGLLENHRQQLTQLEEG